MNILADTHILLWALSDNPQLTDLAKKYITDEDNEIFYSSISVWEIEIKHKLHPDLMRVDGKTFSKLCKQSGFHPIGFNEEHAQFCELLNYPSDLPPHKDPFDKALIAQAKVNNFKFITHDKTIINYKEKCIIAV